LAWQQLFTITIEKCWEFEGFSLTGEYQYHMTAAHARHIPVCHDIAGRKERPA